MMRLLWPLRVFGRLWRLSCVWNAISIRNGGRVSVDPEKLWLEEWPEDFRCGAVRDGVLR
jgi:hypothetical protein